MTTNNIQPQDLSWTELKNIVLAVSDQIKETERIVKETSEQMKKTDEQMKRTDEQMKRTDEQMKRNDRKFKELSDRFSSTIGNLTEGLMEPEALRIFKKAGFKVNRYFTNLKKHDKNSNVEMEIDQFMVDGTTAIAMEIKTACNKSDIDHFITKMRRFKEVWPEYADKAIFLAIAAIKYNRSSDKYAHNKGLLVVRATPDNSFSLDSSKNDNLITF
ncbi:MAG: hypothetical protein IKU03_05070 [Bacteroidales bacterium]|nr:hypothetical protein [Bacteroidales bacterium]